ncbi:MAG: class E sortase [Rubrobacteraceae bacterium]
MNRITQTLGGRTLLYILGIVVVALITLLIAMNLLRNSNEPVNTSAQKAASKTAVTKQSDQAAKEKAAKEKAAKDKAAKDKAAKDKAASQQASTTKATTADTTQQVATAAPATSTTKATTADTTQQVATAAPATPSGTDLYLTVPAIGISNSYVANTSDPAALDNGAIHLPQTGFPWQAGSNTYIAGHVLGYAGTGSYLQFAKLPNMVAGDMIYLSDSNGTTYTYRVSRIMTVSPYDTYVTGPVAGQTVVTLQTCVNPPAYDQRYIVQGDLVSTSAG